MTTKRRTPSQTVLALLPLAADVDLVRFEKNLLQIGFFGASDARNKNRTSRRIEQIVFRNGHKVKVAAEFRGSEQLGLPSTTDRDKFIALLKIVSEDRAMAGGHISNPIRFSGYRMIQELGLSRNGEIYEEILRWGKRMTDTTITSEQVVYFAAKKVYSDEVLHVFRAFRRTGSSRLNGTEKQEHYEVILEDWLLENLNQRYVIPEDFNAYKQLTRPTAKGIFGNLHLWFYASQGRPIEKNYEELCNLLNVQTYPHLSKIRSTMGLALNELVAIQYISHWDVQPMTIKKGYKIVLTPGQELLKILQQVSLPERLPSTDERLAGKRTSAKAIARLESFGILSAKATQLVEKYGEEKVLETVEYLHTQMTSRTRGVVENPAGLIIHSLENGLVVPTSFAGESQRKKKDQEEKRKLLQAEARQEAQDAYDKWIEEQRNEALSNRYSEPELQEKLKEIIAVQIRKDEAFRRVPAKNHGVLARQIVIRELTDELIFPTFDEWQKTVQQAGLF